jgi:2-keto-myo-inositol isomerase
MTHPSRRQFLAASGAISSASLTSAMAPRAEAAPSDGQSRFRYCLNAATLRGFKISLTEVIEVTAKAGYQAMEPWVNYIHEYAAGGGSLPDLRRRIADLGLTVESAIAFPQWIVDDPTGRARGLEETKRDMDVVAQIGGKRIAAPPAGPANGTAIGLKPITERYRSVLEVGDRMGVVPELEFWGPSPHLSRLSQAAFVAIETGHPKACVLADIFHLYKGGSDFQGLRLLSGEALQVIHMNDYPAAPPRQTITDADRVYPGDGVAPIKQILGELHQVAPGIVLSLELFNPAYWKGDPLDTARTGLNKMKAAVRGAVGQQQEVSHS